ncbi:RodZ domain-containing protein [Marinimicrobium alkaliphilum]|uniref:RodZ domain-containing protein n=1 Tax=Marinimicrobium alkaliphilum TaxID=2202654 RepID=UPI000DB9328A|nr:RodZ domain-containing protein [Marinimicrobium alkaliphilum]
MTAEHSTPENNDAVAIDEMPVSVGETLRQSREQAGLTQEAVAQQLCMPLGRIQALEADDFARLSSRTFVRGYLRAYSKLLEADPETLLAIYQAQVGDQEERAAVLSGADNGAGNRPFWRPAAVVVALIVAGWLVSSWFFGNRASTDVPASSVVPPSESVAYSDSVANAPLSTEPEILEGDERVGDASREDAESESAEVATPSAEVLAATRVVEQVETPTLDQLGLRFSDECWLEVTDAQGDVLFTDLVQPGRELALEGRAPFQVKMGNAQAVSVELNGEPVELNIPANVRLRTVTVGES